MDTNTRAPETHEPATVESSLDGGHWNVWKTASQYGDSIIDTFHAAFATVDNARVHMESHREWDKLVEACRTWEKHAETLIPAALRKPPTPGE